ncbi:Uncharacterised protein [Rodentibacter pneumotropicus]|uniref:Uncharacterized protein n=1 Tax=Rodentibacter pneumotropicus TaxID=758 RepID=A0A3S4U0K8_9PAST|nr:Uncharacterised protein [Rodentibacter pneumotropicus]
MPSSSCTYPPHIIFQRHGRLGLFHYAQQLFENEVKVIEIEKMAGSEPSEKTDYLLRHKIYGVVPLDPLQLDCHPQKIAPDEILKLLWQNEPIQPNLFEQSADDFIEPVFKNLSSIPHNKKGINNYLVNYYHH